MYLFVDVEANGIAREFDAPPSDVEKWSRLVQAAWALTDHEGRELRTQAFIVRPDGFDIPVSVEKRRGITTETALRLGVEIGVVLKAFAKDLTHAEAVVAHNIRYDERMIRAEFHRSGRRMNPFAGKKLHCTMRAGTSLCKLAGQGGYKWPKLQELHSFLFDVPFEVAHDAAADVRACIRCFVELKRRGLVDDEQLFEEIYRLADGSEKFDREEFVNDVHGHFEDRGYLTPAQREKLVQVRDWLIREKNGNSGRRFQLSQWWKPREQRKSKEQA